MENPWRRMAETSLATYLALGIGRLQAAQKKTRLPAYAAFYASSNLAWLTLKGMIGMTWYKGGVRKTRKAMTDWRCTWRKIPTYCNVWCNINLVPAIEERYTRLKCRNSGRRPPPSSLKLTRLVLAKMMTYLMQMNIHTADIVAYVNIDEW